MKDIISITEMAQLRNVTTETLRHYDRIDLLKPAYVDPKTGYRYYSVTQYEKIGTIKELKNLGMSLAEIKDFFQNRTVETSREILTEQKRRIDQQIESLINLRREVNEKIDFLDTIRTVDLDDKIRTRHIDARRYVYFERNVSNEVELSYDSVQLEESLNKSKKQMPIFATNRYGGLIDKNDVLTNKDPLPAKMIIRYDGEEDVKACKIIDIPAGNFVCLYYIGAFWNRNKSIKQIMHYIKENNLKLTGNILQMQWVDFTITDNINDISYEFQAPVAPLF